MKHLGDYLGYISDKARKYSPLNLLRNTYQEPGTLIFNMQRLNYSRESRSFWSAPRKVQHQKSAFRDFPSLCVCSESRRTISLAENTKRVLEIFMEYLMELLHAYFSCTLKLSVEIYR